MDSNDDTLFDVEPALERRCHRCGVYRPLSDFYIKAEQRMAARTGRAVQKQCRLCQREINNARKAPRRAILDELKIAAGGCADCGIFKPDHPEIYDFDHRPGTVKVLNVARFATKHSMDELMTEIPKCDVVCSNCHRIRTQSREHKGFGRDRGDETGKRSNRTRSPLNPGTTLN